MNIKTIRCYKLKSKKYLPVNVKKFGGKIILLRHEDKKGEYSFECDRAVWTGPVKAKHFERRATTEERDSFIKTSPWAKRHLVILAAKKAGVKVVNIKAPKSPKIEDLRGLPKPEPLPTAQTKFKVGDYILIHDREWFEKNCKKDEYDGNVIKYEYPKAIGSRRYIYSDNTIYGQVFAVKSVEKDLYRLACGAILPEWTIKCKVKLEEIAASSEIEPPKPRYKKGDHVRVRDMGWIRKNCTFDKKRRFWEYNGDSVAERIFNFAAGKVVEILSVGEITQPKKDNPWSYQIYSDYYLPEWAIAECVYLAPVESDVDRMVKFFAPGHVTEEPKFKKGDRVVLHTYDWVKKNCTLMEDGEHYCLGGSEQYFYIPCVKLHGGKTFTVEGENKYGVYLSEGVLAPVWAIDSVVTNDAAPEPKFKVGDKVEILRGVWEGNKGEVLRVNDLEGVAVMIKGQMGWLVGAFNDKQLRLLTEPTTLTQRIETLEKELAELKRRVG